MCTNTIFRSRVASGVLGAQEASRRAKSKIGKKGFIGTIGTSKLTQNEKSKRESLRLK